VLDIVAGDYGDRLFGRQPAAKQGGADALCVGEDLRVGEFAPFALRVPLRKKHAVRRSLRPIFQRLAQVVAIAAKTLRGADMNDAVRSLLKNNVRSSQPHCAKWRGCLRFDACS
jgi:hypothetical protein